MRQISAQLVTTGRERPVTGCRSRTIALIVHSDRTCFGVARGTFGQRIICFSRSGNTCRVVISLNINSQCCCICIPVMVTDRVVECINAAGLTVTCIGVGSIGIQNQCSVSPCIRAGCCQRSIRAVINAECVIGQHVACDRWCVTADIGCIIHRIRAAIVNINHDNTCIAVAVTVSDIDIEFQPDNIIRICCIRMINRLKLSVGVSACVRINRQRENCYTIRCSCVGTCRICHRDGVAAACQCNRGAGHLEFGFEQTICCDLTRAVLTKAVCYCTCSHQWTGSQNVFIDLLCYLINLRTIIQYANLQCRAGCITISICCCRTEVQCNRIIWI